MKKTTILIIIAVIMTTTLLADDAFSSFAVQNTDFMKKMIGKWQLSERSYLYEFTNNYMKHIDGFPYYRYRISQFPGKSTYIYSVFKSKKTGKSYFCRGFWSHKTGFRYSVSRIRFKDNDKFIVYSEDNEKEIYFIATRIKPVTTLQKKPKKYTKDQKLHTYNWLLSLEMTVYIKSIGMNIYKMGKYIVPPLF